MSAKAIGVVFDSHGISCGADLYRPDDAAEPMPCVVIGHGFSGTKGLARVDAERFAEAGFAVLVFDYHHFGASGGEPRQRVDLDLTDNARDVETLGGYVFAQLGRPAAVGDEVPADDQRLRVEAIDGLRVARVLPVPVEPVSVPSPTLNPLSETAAH